MKKLLPKFLVLILLPCVLLVGCKPSTSNDIRVNGKILSFMMTRDEVVKLIGEGKLVKSYQVPDLAAFVEIYQYDGFTATFDTHTDEIIPYLVSLVWTSSDFKTFNGLTVGSSYEKLKNKVGFLDSKKVTEKMLFNYSANETFYGSAPSEYDPTQLDTQYVYTFDMDTEKIVAVSAHSYNQFYEKFPLIEN